LAGPRFASAAAGRARHRARRSRRPTQELKTPHLRTTTTTTRYLKRRATEALAALDGSATTPATPAPSSSSLLAGVGAETPEAAAAAYSRAAEELRAFERQAIVYDLYKRKDLKNVLEVDAEAAAAKKK
jgi:hypothetical protein